MQHHEFKRHSRVGPTKMEIQRSTNCMIKTNSKLKRLRSTTQEWKIDQGHELEKSRQELKFHDWSTYSQRPTDPRSGSKHDQIMGPRVRDAKSRNLKVESSDVQNCPDVVRRIRTALGHRYSNMANSKAQTGTQLDPIRTQLQHNNIHSAFHPQSS